MKKLLSPSHRGLPSSATLRIVLSLVLTAAFAAGLWVATMPAVQAARTMTPTEMIQEGLPPGKTVRSAAKPELLSAVCAAVKKHRPQSAEITKTAIVAHRTYAGDIVATVLRCGPRDDCAFVGRVVGAAVVVAPAEASVIDDAALAIAPDCADAIQAAIERDGKDIPAEGPGPDNFEGGLPTNQVPLPGSIGGGGGGFNPQEQLLLVCDNGTQRRVRESQLGAFLSSHPGSFVGSCQPTPTTNQ